jgi:hypothetical protein
MLLVYLLHSLKSPAQGVPLSPLSSYVGSSDAWVKLYINGINKPEWTFGPFTLNKSKQAWDVATIQWPKKGSSDPVVVQALQIWTLKTIFKCIGCTCQLR